VNSKAQSHLSATSRSKYLLPPAERREVGDVEAVESVRRHRCQCRAPRRCGTPDPWDLLQMLRRDGAGVRQGCIGASEPDHLGRPICQTDLVDASERSGLLTPWRIRGKGLMCLQQCVVTFHNRNTEGCRRLRGNTRRRKTICSGAEDSSTGAQHRTKNGHTKTYRRQNNFDLTTQHTGSLWGDRCRIRVDCDGSLGTAGGSTSLGGSSAKQTTDRTLVLGIDVVGFGDWSMQLDSVVAVGSDFSSRHW